MEYRYRDASEMKDSGVEWIGKIPSDWEVLKIKRIIDIINGNGFPERLQGKNNGDIPFYKVSDINFEGNYIFEAQNYVDLLEVNNNKWNIIKPNTIIIPKIGEALKKNHRKISTTNCLIDNNMCGIVSKGANVKYLLYLFKLVDMEWYLNPGAVPSINISQLKDDKSMLPEIVEQEKIGKFLDKKTSHFDSIISKKEALIEKLEEAKKSLISEVVTGKVKVVKSDAGYDLVKRNSDEMKDSGVEWLGEIPKDWNCTKLKNICNNITDGAHISPETKNGVYPFISVKDLNENGLDFNNCLLTSIENYMYLKNNSCNPSVNDILISKDGTIGKTTTINYDKEFVVASSLVILTPSSDYKSEYVEYILNSNFVQKQIRKYVKGTALPRISIMHLKDIILPYTLDKNEQELMITYLKEKNVLIKALIQKTKQQIEKLKEAKQSLISEAVTGKIEILD